jgi:hypothetical protein
MVWQFKVGREALPDLARPRLGLRIVPCSLSIPSSGGTSRRSLPRQLGMVGLLRAVRRAFLVWSPGAGMRSWHITERVPKG